MGTPLSAVSCVTISRSDDDAGTNPQLVPGSVGNTVAAHSAIRQCFAQSDMGVFSGQQGMPSGIAISSAAMPAIISWFAEASGMSALAMAGRAKGDKRSPSSATAARIRQMVAGMCTAPIYHCRRFTAPTNRLDRWSSEIRRPVIPAIVRTSGPGHLKRWLTNARCKMTVMRKLLMRTFGRPQGVLGRLGGVIMARTNADFGAWVADLLEIEPEMLAQAQARNMPSIQNGRVDLRQGFVEDLPFDDNRFDKAWAVNSMQIWPDAVAGLREIRRVMKPGGGIALGFTPYSGQPNSGLPETLNAAGFVSPHIVNSEMGFCALATKPL
jgi:hypothetical protein